MARSYFIVWLLFSACLHGFSQHKQELVLPGLQAPVEVVRDKWGINHIYAANQHDLFFAQGYAAAKDRLFQFEVWRRQATGTVAEILGPQELKRDIGTRLFRYRGDLNKEFSHYHKDGIAIFNAYTDGVNAYIDEVLANPTLLPFEFKKLGILPGKWTPDVVVSRHQGLLGNIEEELNTARAVAIAGAEKVKELVWFHPKQPDLNMDASITREMLSKDIIGLYKAYRRPVVFKTGSQATALNPESPVEKGVEGSNNWILSGNKTTSGYPIMANDPHRSISMPSLRYMVHLVAPGWNAIGGGEPVIPGISIGHNEFGAWGLTIFETDGEDLYVYDLNPANLQQYWYRNQWVSMQEIKDTIRVKGVADEPVTLRYTRHGPVTFIDTANRKAYAIRCAWLEPGGAPYLASLRMNQARNWKDFREACRYSHIPAENMIWADRKGNIGWQAVGITPVRKNFSGMVPVPGDGRYEWKGYLDILKRPHLYNPAKGFFATANQHVTPDSYTRMNAIGFSWADPYRGNRINEVLGENKRFTMADNMSLQTDYFSIPARSLVPLLKDITLPPGLPEEAKKKLLSWDFVLDKNSVAAGIYAMWERKLMSQAAESFIPRDIRGLVDFQLTILVGWLQQPGARFGVDSFRNRDAFLVITLQQAIEELSKRFGPSTDAWVYGQSGYKHTSFTHPLDALLTKEEKAVYNLAPLPRGGNSHTPNSTGGLDRQGSGASFRIITDLEDWNKTLMINTPGQSSDPAGKYYKNLYETWAKDQYFPAYYSREKIQANADEHTILKPASR